MHNSHGFNAKPEKPWQFRLSSAVSFGLCRPPCLSQGLETFTERPPLKAQGGSFSVWGWWIKKSRKDPQQKKSKYIASIERKPKRAHWTPTTSSFNSIYANSFFQFFQVSWLLLISLGSDITQLSESQSWPWFLSQGNVFLIPHPASPYNWDDRFYFVTSCFWVHQEEGSPGQKRWEQITASPSQAYFLVGFNHIVHLTPPIFQPQLRFLMWQNFSALNGKPPHLVCEAC